MSYLLIDGRPGNLYSALYVIRPNSELVSSYYLFLYLRSDTARKYAMRYQRGAVLRKTDIQTLRNFPIVIPSRVTQDQSRRLFERLFLRRGDDPLSEINKLLFTPQHLPQKAIQKEFILEIIENLREDKKELISDFLMGDFRELESCLEVGAHKSCLILCGSILEAVLLDWLSEIEQKDYFDTDDKLMLGRLIEKLREPLAGTYPKARLIGDRRNLVHPKQLLKSNEEISNDTCRAVLNDLKEVLRQRGLKKI